MDREDPWDWPVADVVSALCYPSHGQWNEFLWEGRPSATRPDSSALKKALEENQIDGSTLLLHADRDTIRDFLNIRSFGQISSLLWAIKKLRERSRKWNSQHLEHIWREEEHLIQSAIPKVEPSRSPSAKPSLASQIPPQDDSTLPRAREGEILIQTADGGQKRRKLLTKSSAQPLGRDVLSFTGNDEAPNAYLGRKGVRLDDVVFVEQDEDSDSGEESAKEFFVVRTPGNIPTPGQSKFVERRLRHLSCQNLEHLGSSRYSLFPYPERLVNSKDGHPALVVEVRGTEAFVLKRDALYMQSEGVADDSGDHSWDFLKKWINVKDDNVLPLYGESDSEDEIQGSLADEIARDEEEPEVSLHTRVLRADDVAAVIEYAIRAFETEWEERRRPKLEKGARRTWKSVKGRKGRQVVNACKFVMDKLDVRLGKLKKEISEQVWTSRDKLRKQCESMCETILDREDQSWKLRLWQEKYAPPRPLPSTTPKAKKPKAPVGSEDEGGPSRERLQRS